MPDKVISGSRRFQFGLFEVDLRSGELRRQGVRIKLQEQPFQVLTMLLDRPGELVTREEIRQCLWPDTIVEFESNLNAVIKRLREALDDGADNPRFVETVRGRGYRFLFTAGLQTDHKEADVETHDASIAVLPFRDRSPRGNQEYFCDGITDELTDALTKFENLRVVSRTSAFQYKNKTEDVRRIGCDLNVSALLEGSLQKTDKSIRITVRLTRVKDGCQFWTENYDCDARAVFEIQSEISGAIVSALNRALGWSLSHASGSRLIFSRPTLTTDLVAYDLYLKGMYFWNQGNEAGVRASIPYFEQAIERDENYALAHAAMGQAFMFLASAAEDPEQRRKCVADGQKEVARYLSLIQENYEKNRS